MTKTLRCYFTAFNYLERRGVERGRVTSDTLNTGLGTSTRNQATRHSHILNLKKIFRRSDFDRTLVHEKGGEERETVGMGNTQGIGHGGHGGRVSL